MDHYYGGYDASPEQLGEGEPEAINAHTFLASLKLVEPPPITLPFSYSRWPYTYAYDYVRGCVDKTTGKPNYSRSDVGKLLNRYVREALGDNANHSAVWAHKERIVIELAKRYCKQHNIAIPEDING